MKSITFEDVSREDYEVIRSTIADAYNSEETIGNFFYERQDDLKENRKMYIELFLRNNVFKDEVSEELMSHAIDMLDDDNFVRLVFVKKATIMDVLSEIVEPTLDDNRYINFQDPRIVINKLAFAKDTLQKAYDKGLIGWEYEFLWNDPSDIRYHLYNETYRGGSDELKLIEDELMDVPHDDFFKREIIYHLPFNVIAEHAVPDTLIVNNVIDDYVIEMLFEIDPRLDNVIDAYIKRTIKPTVIDVILGSDGYGDELFEAVFLSDELPNRVALAISFDLLDRWGLESHSDVEYIDKLNNTIGTHGLLSVYSEQEVVSLFSKIITYNDSLSASYSYDEQPKLQQIADASYETMVGVLEERDFDLTIFD